jgi:hypothetical protein
VETKFVPEKQQPNQSIIKITARPLPANVEGFFTFVQLLAATSDKGPPQFKSALDLVPLNPIHAPVPREFRKYRRRYRAKHHTLSPPAKLAFGS